MMCTAWMNQETHAKRHRELKWETPQQSGIVWLQLKCCARPWYHSVCIRCAFDLALSSHSGSSCQVFCVVFWKFAWIQNNEKNKNNHKLYTALCQRRRLLVQCDISIKWTWRKHNLRSQC